MNKTENIPRVMIAAANSGSGKTTITCGIIGSLISENLKVSSFKCGPDYIDPLFHSGFLGASSSNIDLFLQDKNTVNYLIYKNSKESDISIIEGVMGFYDGLGGVSEEKSAYDISQVTKTPVILVINCKGMSVSIVAQIKGYLEYRKNNIKAVILNNISKMLYPKMKEKIENELKIKVVGYLEYNENIAFDDRKLGLIPLWEEKEKSLSKINLLIEMSKKTLNIEEIKDIAKNADPITFCDENIKENLKPINLNGDEKLKIAVPKDKAFCFCYNDNLNVLKSLGAEIITFSPLNDEKLPENIDGIYFCGGFIEEFSNKLSKNISLKNSIKTQLENGLPAICEGGGYVYLTKSYEKISGEVFNLVSFFDNESYETQSLKRFGYTNITANTQTTILKKGESINCHSFHYTDCKMLGNAVTACKQSTKKQWNCGEQKNNVFGSFAYLNFYSNLSVPKNFLNACLEYRRKNKVENKWL